MAALEDKDKRKKISNVRVADTVSNEKPGLRQVLQGKYLNCMVCLLHNIYLVFSVFSSLQIVGQYPWCTPPSSSRLTPSSLDLFRNFSVLSFFYHVFYSSAFSISLFFPHFHRMVSRVLIFLYFLFAVFQYTSLIYWTWLILTYNEVW